MESSIRENNRITEIFVSQKAKNNEYLNTIYNFHCSVQVKKGIPMSADIVYWDFERTRKRKEKGLATEKIKLEKVVINWCFR